MTATQPTWTDQQAQEWAAAQTWLFASYYKYCFTFRAAADGITATASAGGHSGDIYRYEVSDPMTWAEVTGAGLMSLEIRRGSDQIYPGPPD